MKLKRLMAVLVAVAVFALIVTVMPATIFAVPTTPFDGDLTSGKTWIRHNRDSGDYYYFAKRIVPDTSGNYTIQIVGGDYIDTYMVLYEDCFNKNKRYENDLTFNDDGNPLYGLWSIIVNYPLIAGEKYIVVVTTYSEEVTGHLDVYVIGDGWVTVSDKVACASAAAAKEEPAWVRGDQQMVCQYVWINEDGDFQFSFIYPYADNNWVRIFDMDGNMVYEVDMPYYNPNIIVELPDGMYTVKTFHDQPEPIQEFVIGKP